MSAPDVLIADRYRLVRQLGSGGMGVVWEAWDERLHRKVALKQLRAQPGLSPEEVQLSNNRALREARINARLHHRYAVPVFDVVEHAGQPCLIMQFVSSVPLSVLLRDHGPLEPTEAAQVGAQVGSALAAAHQAGIVHRDVKPGNILVADDGTALISDFGISHAMGDVTLTQTGMVHGTPAYLAPEVARGGEASFASDVFSLGATLYAALEGGPPFGTDSNSIALLYRVAAGEFPRPQHSGPLTPVLVDMLAADPDARPDMTTVARRLDALTASGPPINVLAAGAPELTQEPAGPDAPEPAEAAAAPEAPAEPAAATDAATRVAAAPMPPSAPEPTAESLRTTHVASRQDTAPAADASTDQRTTVARSQPPVASTADPATPRRPAPPVDHTIGLAEDPPPGGRRRRRAPLVAVAVVLVAAALITALVLGQRSGGTLTAGTTPSASQPEATTDPSDSAASPTEESSTSAPPSSAASSRAPSTPAATPTPTSSASVNGKPTSAELAAAISSYYALVPDNLDEAWPRLSSSYQRDPTGGRSSYERFWGNVTKVSVSDVKGDPPNSAQATVRYTFKNGTTAKEKTSYKLVLDDGVLKINGSTVLSST